MDLVKVNEEIEDRKVFYVDVGAMSSKEAEEYLSKLTNEYRNQPISSLQTIAEVIGIAGSFGGF